MQLCINSSKPTVRKKKQLFLFLFSFCILLFLRAMGTMRLRFLLCNRVIQDKNDCLLSIAEKKKKKHSKIARKTSTISIWEMHKVIIYCTKVHNLQDFLVKDVILPAKIHKQTKNKPNSLLRKTLNAKRFSKIQPSPVLHSLKSFSVYIDVRNEVKRSKYSFESIPLGGKSISPDVSPIKFGLWACTLCLYIGLEVFVILGASGLQPSVSYVSSKK